VSIYCISKTKHAPMWRKLRADGAPIISTWIDEAGPGETKDFGELWTRCLTEVHRSTYCVAYIERGDELHGGLIEIGAALHAGHVVRIVIKDIVALRQLCEVPKTLCIAGLKTAQHHPLIQICESMDDALGLADSLK